MKFFLTVQPKAAASLTSSLTSNHKWLAGLGLEYPYQAWGKTTNNQRMLWSQHHQNLLSRPSLRRKGRTMMIILGIIGMRGWQKQWVCSLLPLFFFKLWFSNVVCHFWSVTNIICKWGHSKFGRPCHYLVEDLYAYCPLFCDTFICIYNELPANVNL